MAKVDIITCNEVKFGKLSWWSNWVDIAVYDYECRPWLIQMKVNRYNKKEFRSVAITGRAYKQTSTIKVGDLTQMKGGNNE